MEIFFSWTERCWWISLKIFMKSHYYCFFEKGLNLGGQKMVITYQCIAARCMHASHGIQWLLYAVPLVSLCFFKKRTNLMQRGLPISSQLLKIIIINRKMIKNIVTMIPYKLHCCISILCFKSNLLVNSLLLTFLAFY